MASAANGIRSRVSSRFGGLWRDSDFLRLWAAQSVSLLGSQVGALALPLVAVLALRASPLQVALLSAASWAPYLFVSLFAGLWVDRHPRRPIMIAADLGRAGLLAVVPLSYALEALSIELLYAVALLSGALTVFFSLAYGSYLPSLVPRERLVEGNTKLQVSSSVAEVGGPSLGGLLVQVLTAPLAVALDALSFVASALSLSLIRKPEPAVAAERGSAKRDVVEGLRITFSDPYLRAVCGEAATYNLFEQVILALWVVYATRELGLSPALLGAVLGAGAVGALLGSVIASRLSARLGYGRALIGSMVVCCAPLGLIPLAAGPTPAVVATLTLGFFLNGVGLGMSNVYVRSLLQAVTPPGLMGRVLASYSFFNTGAIPLGALLAGLLQGMIGLRTTLGVGALGVLAGLLWVLLSGPVRDLRSLPESPTLRAPRAAEEPHP